MKHLSFSYDRTCQINNSLIEQTLSKIVPLINHIKTEMLKGYDTDYAFVNVPHDSNNLKNVKELVEKKRNLSPTILIVIGIGGSNLGAIAIYEALKGKFYNNKNQNLKVFFADTVDSDYICDIYNFAEKELRAYHNVIINVISKSGNTTETVAIFQLFLNLLKKYKFEKFNDYVVITTDKNSTLWDFAHEIECSLLEIPKKVGGRFSVFSSVGLFPLELLRVDCQSLLAGAQSISNDCLDNNVLKNFAAISAAIVFLHYKNGIKINDTFLFSVELESIGKWYRQLLAESDCKEFNLKNEKVDVAITPTVSIGSTDLHSLGQLYLSSSQRFTTFVNIQNLKTNLTTPKLQYSTDQVPNISNVEFKKIMDSIIKGVQASYFKNSIPFCEILLNSKSEFDLGQFLQFKMFEIIYLAHLFDINPFDQPNVEFYKKETKSILNGNS